MMEVLREQMGLLVGEGLYDSAEMLGCFLISASLANSELTPIARAESLILLADALYGRKEYKRALNLYRQALQQCKAVPRQMLGGPRASVPVGGRAPLVNAGSPVVVNDSEVRYKIGLCHLAVNDPRAALSEIDQIPSKSRTLRINLTLAKLHRVTGNDRSATFAYRDCLRQCPYLLEAIVALAELGVGTRELHSYFPQGQGKSTRGPADHHDPVRWLQRLADGHCSIAAHDYKGALEHFNYLGQRFPNNVYLLLETAKTETALGKAGEGIHNYEKARQADHYNIHGMDEYAMLLHKRGHQDELNRLVHDLLSIDATRPEVWVASSVYWDMRDDKIRAVTYAEKSMAVDERHAPAYLVKGGLSLSLNRSEAAVMAFRKAQNLRPDLRAYQGLVQAYLAIPKHKEALCVAREAMKAMPQSPVSLTLLGDVYAQTADGREKGRKFYESALRIEPGYLGAVLALADLHAAEGRNKDAIILLQRYLKNWVDDSLHAKLAQVLVLTNELGEALTHYQIALSLNASNETAKKGLERLEKQMKGLDPDALEEEEDNEGEDGDGDEGEFQ